MGTGERGGGWGRTGKEERGERKKGGRGRENHSESSKERRGGGLKRVREGESTQTADTRSLATLF